VLNIAFVVSLGAASGLGAGGSFVWAPVPLGIATLLSAVTHWLAPAELLAAVTSALAVLNSLDLRWHGSDIRENRSDASKHRLITDTERIARVLAMIYTGSTAMSDGAGDEEDWSPGGHLGMPKDEQALAAVGVASW